MGGSGKTGACPLPKERMGRRNPKELIVGDLNFPSPVGKFLLAISIIRDKKSHR